MKMSLENAGLNADQIDYVNTHGTSTPTGDGLEAMAVAKLFDQSKNRLNVSSTKSMTGHLLGAAGGVEAIVSTLAMIRGIVPPTINLDEIDGNAHKLN
jgi:3-oxoacyl-[acyl-carrier-protein] synthase II